ncbi:unnamed protein product [Adineta ricciae]|uniref:Uncharacterized protein n=1 Tax=Adineta ricciae TaxID=249248 RepID=A0A815PAP3_ADIRI|nr:unnamed protein product [Adineta ricciae]
MNDSSFNIVNLCDEILLTIYNKLDNMDVLYSLIGVNGKLDRLARDITFTQCVDLSRIFSNEKNNLRKNSIIDRFCFDVLPQIHDHIQSLTLDALLIDRILHLASYPKLHQLTLLNVQFEMASRIFDGTSYLVFYVS